MKENLKNKKGITLIALVITIIVLLILAIVTIRIVVNQNIINHANNAVTAYNEAQQNEVEQLTWAEELMKNKGGSASTTSGNSNLPENWYLPTEEEKSKMGYPEEEDIPFIAGTLSGGDASVYLMERDGETHAIQLFDKSGKLYSYLLTDAAVEYMEDQSEKTGLQKNIWYVQPSDGSAAAKEITVYTGSCPVEKQDFSAIYCESYLDKVMASFN